MWWVLVMTVVLSGLGLQMLNTSLIQWQLMQRTQDLVRALWLAETKLNAMELGLRADMAAVLLAPPGQPLMPELPVSVQAQSWQPYGLQPAAGGLTLGARGVALGPACLDPQVPCHRFVYHTVVLFNADGERVLALRAQLKLQQTGVGRLSLQAVSWEWL